MSKPRLIDLFCGAGGTGMGYHRSGFEVIGVDIEPQPNYPFEFIQMDAVEYLESNPGLEGFHAAHGSPPCQGYSNLRVLPYAGQHPQLIDIVREQLARAGKPYVIENVVGSPLRDAFTLCGASLGLGTSEHDLARHRRFDCNFFVMIPPCAHGSRKVMSVHGDHVRDNRRARKVGEGQFSRSDRVALASEIMDIDWMQTWDELRNAVPPVYTEHIGQQLLPLASTT